MPEETLPGGRTTGAVLIGSVVHKPAAPWTPSVHALLRHLEKHGFTGAPRALGFDEQGREMLTYLPGETIGTRDRWPGWARADSMLVQVGQWLRRVHDLTADFEPPPDARWFTGATLQPGWVVGHQDAAPYNAVVDGDRLVGFVDWDIAGPSPREVDLAFSMMLWAPLTGDDRPYRRVHLFLDAYGYEGDRRVFATAVPDRARRQAAVIREMAAGGHPASVALLPVAEQLEKAATNVDGIPPDFWTPSGSIR
jgi:hypothetical protein